MQENPFFSIITVTLDSLPGLQATDRSLMLQSFRDFEWIVVDGGSKDGTRDFLQHSSATSISHPDAAFFEGMNMGLARASGDYVLFLGAGDRLAYANTLARLRNFIRSESTPPDFIYGDTLEGGAYKSARGHDHLKLGMFTPHQAMICRRGMLNGLSYDTRYRIAADYDLTARLLQRSKNISYFPLPVCAFEQAGTLQQKTARARSEQFLVRKRLKIAGLLENSVIYLLQFLSGTAGRFRPAFNWRAKSPPTAQPGFAQN
ncbi:MAG: glycosyltransferase [Alphaproteobacteria bacterium]